MAEKASAVKSKNMFLKLLLPKAPFSPNKDKRSSEKPRSGFSGGGATTMSIIPADALHSKSRNSSLREPTSPKVSCMGQVKHKKKLCNLINNNYCYQESVLPPLDHLNRMVQNHSKSKKSQSHHKQNPCALDQPADKSLVDAKKKKNKPLAIRNMFTRVPSVRRKSDAATDYASDHRASSCSLSQMRRLSSGRNSLSNFDWTTAQVAPDHSNSCGELQVKFSRCALILQECKAVSLEPRKEVNLWKRRTMAQPSPLQLKNID